MAGTAQGWTLDGWPRTLAALVSMLDQPAAIVRAGAEVLAHNAAWRRLTGAHAGNGADEGHSAAAASAQHPEPGTKHQQLSLTRCLGDGRDAHALADTLAAATPQHGSAGLALDGKACTARWVSLQPESNVALVVVEGVTATTERQAKVIARQRARIERLLIHQTIIEETERRRLGRALHDVVAQDLASVRSAVIGLCDTSPGEAAPLAALLDGVIEQVRTLSFELSPPVLEDLGLRAAIHWLAEHLGDRYHAAIEVADDDCEPSLDAATRTVAFRVVRELVINAAKHAHGSPILISCVTGVREVRVMVRDTGPGFDAHADGQPDGPADGEHEHFGLTSVREQVRGLGGRFEIISAPGEGTRATVTLPLAVGPDASEGVERG